MLDAVLVDIEKDVGLSTDVLMGAALLLLLLLMLLLLLLQDPRLGYSSS